MSKRKKLSLVPKTKQSTTLKMKIIGSMVGVGLILAAVLLTNTKLTGIYNGNGIKINSDVAHRYNTNFINGEKGILIVEGILKFRKDLYNRGTINCGQCASGAIHFDNPIGMEQLIEGPEMLTFYDIVFNNPDGINLKAVMQAYNSVSFSRGVIKGSYTNPNFILNFLEDAAQIGASDSSHIDGYVGKTGKGVIKFPTGDGTSYKPVGITGGQNSTDQFTAAFFPNDASAASILPGAPFDPNIRETMLISVNESDIWDINGDQSTQITLYWEPSDAMGVFAQQPGNLVVAGWDGAQWVNLGNSGFSGALNQDGSITSTFITPDNYHAFTFATIDIQSLPVEWMSFTGNQVENFVLLEWSTVWETNSRQFDVERSFDGSIFQKIGEVAAVGSSQEPSFYEFPDKDLFPNESSSMYYRLRQIDVTGNFNHSNIIQVSKRDIQVANKVKVFPNPTQNGLTIRYQIFEENPGDVMVTASNGQIVSKQQVEGDGNLRVQTNNWVAGIYNISLVTKEQTITKRAILLN